MTIPSIPEVELIIWLGQESLTQIEAILKSYLMMLTDQTAIVFISETPRPLGVQSARQGAIALGAGLRNRGLPHVSLPIVI